MNSQNDSAKQKSGNVSELEMVGALLFGSISDEKAEDQPYAQMKSGNSGRKVNLGSHIAPETSRQWDDAEPETISNFQEASPVSGVFPEHDPAPIPSPVKTPARKNSWVMRVYGISMIFMTLCVVVLGWQLFVEKKGESKESPSTVVDLSSGVVNTEVPMVPTIEEPFVENAEGAFAPISVEDASKLADSNPMPVPSDTVAALPDAYGTVGQGMNEAPVYQAYGDSVEIAEEYPTFNAELAGVSAAPVYTPAPAVAPVATPAPAVNPAPAQQYAGTTWNAGESMEEVPVFNSEISNFNAAPTAPQVAQTAPQVGSMAPMPTSLPQYNAPEQSPRKLTPPTVGHIDPNAAVQPSAPVSPETSAEEIPTFNPNLGVDGALPVSYY